MNYKNSTINTFMDSHAILYLDEISHLFSELKCRYDTNMKSFYLNVASFINSTFIYVSDKLEIFQESVSDIYDSIFHPIAYNLVNHNIVLVASFATLLLLSLFILYSTLTMMGKYLEKKTRKLTKYNYYCAFGLSMLFFIINSIAVYPKSIFNVNMDSLIQIIRTIQTPSIPPLIDFQLLGDDFYLTPLTFSFVFLILGCFIILLWLLDILFESVLTPTIGYFVDIIDRNIINKEKYDRIKMEKDNAECKRRLDILLERIKTQTTHKSNKEFEADTESSSTIDLSDLFIENEDQNLTDINTTGIPEK